MVRRVIVLLAVFVGACLWAGSALADTTVGETGTNGAACTPFTDSVVVQTGVSGGSSYTFPSAGTITSWSVQAGADVGPMAAVVVRSTGVPNQYTVVGVSSTETPTANSLNTFSTSIAVQAGDLLGFWLGGATNDCAHTGGSSDTYAFLAGVGSSPSVGSSGIYFNATMLRLNISATLGSSSSGTSATQRTPDHMFVCYSKFEQDGGMVVTEDVGRSLIDAGGWVPVALPGNVAGGDNIGDYHLACNPPPDATPTGTYLSDGGLIGDADTLGWYAIDT